MSESAVMSESGMQNQGHGGTLRALTIACLEEESEKVKRKPPKVCQMKPKSSGPGSGSSIYQLRDIRCFWVKWKNAERGKVGFLLHITTWR